jgi:branched-chain amino acid transport system substrate-binding protein
MTQIRQVLFIAPLLLLGCGQKPAAEPILVGHVAAFTGAEKTAGEHARRGIDLAIEETKQPDRQVLSRSVVVEHADTRSDPGAVRGAAVRLLTISHVAGLLGGQELGQAENLGALGRSHATPIIVSSQPTTVPSAGFLFYTGLAPMHQGEALARFAINELKVSQIAALYRTSSGEAEPRAEAFIKGIPADKLLGRWSYGPDDKFKPTIQALLEKKPAAVMFSGPVDDLLALTKNGLDAKIPVFYLGTEDAQDKVRQSADPRIVYVASVYADDPELASLKEFAGKYREKFQEVPDRHAVLAYDDARILFEAMRQAGTWPLEGAKVNESLGKLQFASLTGPLSFSPAGLAQRTVFIVELQNGKATLKKRYESDTKQGRRPTSLAEPLAAR